MLRNYDESITRLMPHSKFLWESLYLHSDKPRRLELSMFHADLDDVCIPQILSSKLHPAKRHC